MRKLPHKDPRTPQYYEIIKTTNNKYRGRRRNPSQRHLKHFCNHTQLAMVAHTFNSSIWETEADGSQSLVTRWPGLPREIPS